MLPKRGADDDDPLLRKRSGPRQRVDDPVYGETKRITWAEDRQFKHGQVKAEDGTTSNLKLVVPSKPTSKQRDAIATVRRIFDIDTEVDLIKKLSLRLRRIRTRDLTLEMMTSILGLIKVYDFPDLVQGQSLLGALKNFDLMFRSQKRDSDEVSIALRRAIPILERRIARDQASLEA